MLMCVSLKQHGSKSYCWKCMPFAFCFCNELEAESQQLNTDFINIRVLTLVVTARKCANHDDVIKWKHLPRYWPFVRGIHRFQVNSPHKGQWCGALLFTLICARINGWVNNREAGYLRRNRTQYDVIVMIWRCAVISGRSTHFKLDMFQWRFNCFNDLGIFICG